MSDLGPEKIAARTVRLAPFGKHTRYLLVGYLRHVLLVTSVLLAIALTIDLWPQFQVVASHHARNGLDAVWNVMRFCALRTPGLVAPFLSFATYLGVLWTEMALTQSNERMLVWNSGRSPAQCLAPVILLGIILGAGEFGLDAYLGPAAMSVQMQERFGLDGKRLDRTRRGDIAWIAVPEGLLRTEIEYGPPPVLHNLTYFKRDSAGRLSEVDRAAVARALPGTGLWRLSNGRAWTAADMPGGTSRPAIELGSPAGETMVPFAAKRLALDLDPLWLNVYRMETQYLPLHVLRPLAASDRNPETKGLYRTRLQVLYGEALLPGAMALLAASLSMLLLAYSTPITALIGIMFAGYFAHFGTKACLLMGQTGYMSSFLAGWLVPAGLSAASLIVFAAMARQAKG